MIMVILCTYCICKEYFIAIHIIDYFLVCKGTIHIMDFLAIQGVRDKLDR
jgi:hypothetical protein